MKNPSVIFVACFIILSVLSCNKKGVNITPKTGTLYFAGADGNKAVYWENGTEYTLPTTLGARVASISVSGSNVYFVGFEGPGTEESFPSPAVYWNNGIKHTFSYLNSVINSDASNFSSLNLVAKVAFSGQSIYVGGTTNNRAMYWLNGTQNVMPTIDPVSTGSYVNDMFLSGTDIYLAGYDGGHHLPSYWKNGVETVLPLADTLKNLPTGPTALGEVARIYVLGTDVYCTGWDGYTVAYWKNGVEHTLPVINVQTAPTSTVTIEGIVASGSDLYICGIDGNNAVYWKNGVETKLPSTGTSNAAGLAVEGNDVYIVGSDNVNPVYWKNGIEVSLPVTTPNASIGSAVAVVYK